MGDSPLFGGDYAAAISPTVSSQDGPRMTVNTLMSKIPKPALAHAVSMAKKKRQRRRKGVK